jgi:DNA-binding NarL/FixJ family response regulator
MTRLVIVDDHDAVREALTLLLVSYEIEVVGAAGGVAAARDLVKRAEPDVALVDTVLPDGDGVDLARELLASRPALGVVLYTGEADADQLYSGLDTGARGYALKASPVNELVDAIQRVAAGGSYVDPRLDRILLSPRATARVGQLSPSKWEIMQRMADGGTAEPTATRLTVPVAEIRRYLRDVLDKLRRRKR